MRSSSAARSIACNDFINNPTEFGGVYTYPSTLALGEDLVTPGAKNYSSFIEDFGLAEYAYNTIDFALFVQDQWRPMHRLTINYGMRWDKETMPTPFAPNPAVPLTQKFPTDWKSFGPRAGVAYDVTGKGKTVIRGGYGIYYGRIPNGIIAYALQNTGLTDPAKALVSLTLQPTDPNAPVYPNILSVRTYGRESLYHIDASREQLRAAARAGLHDRRAATIAAGIRADGELCAHLRRSSGDRHRFQSARAAIHAHL